MRRIRKRFTYANVMSTIALFLVLGGGAFALGRLPRKSVGTRQLKAGAVTAAKLHANAVTKAKIKVGAVDGGKIADGSVTGTDINAESTPFGRVVARLRGTAPLGLAEELKVFPLNPSTYTQAANEVDTYYGAVDVTFADSCKAPREATALLLVDSANPAKVEPSESLAGLGFAEDKGEGTVTKRIEVGPYLFFGSRFEPGSSKSRTVNLAVEGECKGGGSGITATFGGVDVIGTK
ncbi:MAG: hypothetical protein WBM00_10055 [Solirubrobacterales bacterium]